MNIPFIKIQNVGNDYIYIDRGFLSRRKISKSSLAKRICDRRKGIGSDGIFILERISHKSAFVEMYNSDGTSMEFCGNGIRGSALYIREKYKNRARSISILTEYSEYDVRIIESSKSNQVASLRIGNPSFDSAVIGYSRKSKSCLGVRIKGAKSLWNGYCVAMPNPHVVIFVDNFDFEWQKEGAAIENSRLFKNRINVMFTKMDSKGRLTVKPWERGAGATLSCGSGAAAATVVSSLLGYTKNKVSVSMPGGVLKTDWNISENAIYQEGSSELVCSGSYRY